MVTLDDIKVLAARAAGTLKWFLPEVDLALKVLVSIASLIYIVLKIKVLIKK